MQKYEARLRRIEKQMFKQSRKESKIDKVQELFKLLSARPDLPREYKQAIVEFRYLRREVDKGYVTIGDVLEATDNLTTHKNLYMIGEKRWVEFKTIIEETEEYKLLINWFANNIN